MKQTSTLTVAPEIYCIALNESELAIRWGISARTLRRWRQEQAGPVYCKLGGRVVYLLTEIEAFEIKSAHFSTSQRVYR